MMWKKRKGNWDKKDKEMLTKELGAKIDLLNLQWIYRAKKYYHMLAPDIYTLLIPIQHKLSNQEFKDLVEAPSVVRNILYSSGNLPDDQYSLPSLAGQSVSLNIYQKMAFCNSDQMVHYCD